MSALLPTTTAWSSVKNDPSCRTRDEREAPCFELMIQFSSVDVGCKWLKVKVTEINSGCALVAMFVCISGCLDKLFVKIRRMFYDHRATDLPVDIMVLPLIHFRTLVIIMNGGTT